MLIVIPGRGGRYRIHPLSGYHLLNEEEDIMRRVFFRSMVVLADVGDDYRSWLQRTELYHPPAEPNAWFRHAMTLVGYGEDDSGSY
ncbi:hypothetical protein TIFTF001_047629 [Ficus carica]|uniref:Uncharacterized protein n=1 Tax=Ficus carica TaxID=3494 RepID=A0AA88CN86_FICCA|nr:hypothetical protein TIFTF001_047629 [Ficus carica]